ncbi:fimbria/pilus outer membrane usher protein [Pseudomonas nicosulfuronedens]
MKKPIFTFSLCRIGVLLLVPISLSGPLAAAAPAGNDIAQVQFNDVFLRQPDGASIDARRFSSGNPSAAGVYRVDIYLDQQWLDRSQVRLGPVPAGSDNIQPCFDIALLERLGVDMNKLGPARIERLQRGGGECIALPELIEGATASFDNGDQRLDISIAQQARLRFARGYVDPKLWDDGVTAGLLSYNGNFYRTRNQGYANDQGYLGLNAGFNAGPWRLRHSGNFNYNSLTGNDYQDIQTNLQRSIAPVKGQLLLGEGFTDGALFDSFGFTGVQIASDDRMYPESQRGYAPTIQGVAQSNARVQVRQNGNIIYETTVAPGPFVIDDLYPTGYGGDLEVAVMEADGQVNLTRVPYAAAVNALRPGVTRFSVTAGEFRRPDLDSQPKLLQATLQQGITNTLSLYGGGQFADDYRALLSGLAINTSYGAFGLDLTQAQATLPGQPERSGKSLRLSYSKLLESTQTNIAVAAYRYSTSGFLSLPDAVAQQDLQSRYPGVDFSGSQRGRLQATASQELAPGFGHFYFSGSTQDYWDRQGRDSQYQLGYSNHYGRTTYGLSASRQFNLNTGDWDNQLVFSLSFPLGEGRHAVRASSTVQSSSAGSTLFQQSLGGTLGETSALAYNLTGSHSGGTTGDNLAGNLAYNSPLASLSGSLSQGEGYSQIGGGLSGTVVAFADGVAFSPGSGDTVAVIEAKDARGARVANINGLSVDRWGHALVTNLSPFSRNEMELDPKGLPMSVELKSTLEHATPTAGAVVKVKFDTEDSGRSAVIRARTLDGKPLPFGAEVRNAQGQPAGTVGQGGRLIARGLKNARGDLQVKWGEDAAQSCRLSYRLPPAAPEDTDWVTLDATCH